MYINRNAEEMIVKTAESFPCIVIYGPRQVGKSTTIDHLFGEKYRKVTLDDLDDRNLAIQNPKLFLETYGWPLIIDEIQKAPLLLDGIKKIIDEQRLIWLKENRPRELMYILTGSNRFELQEGISESLAGRCGVIDMASLSQSEKYGKEGNLFQPEINTLLERERELTDAVRSRKRVFQDLFQGGMPDIVTGVSQREAYFKSYLSTYLEKDVRRKGNLGERLVLSVMIKHQRASPGFMGIDAEVHAVFHDGGAEGKYPTDSVLQMAQLMGRESVNLPHASFLLCCGRGLSEGGGSLFPFLIRPGGRKCRRRAAPAHR